MSIRRFLAVLLLLIISTPHSVHAATRVALVIGNAHYQDQPPLSNPGRDASLIAASLRTAGFTSVQVVMDADKVALERAISSFGATADGADVAMVYYSGHGMEVDGKNYLIPTSARLARDRDIEFEAVSLDAVLNAIDGAHLKIVVLDACRTNPFLATMKRTVATRGTGRGLAKVEPRGETLVVYAARAGETAADGRGVNSPFATSLAKRIGEPGVEIGLTFRHVRDDVLKETGGEQEPFTYGSLSGTEFYFTSPSALFNQIKYGFCWLVDGEKSKIYVTVIESIPWGRKSSQEKSSIFNQFLAYISGAYDIGKAVDRNCIVSDTRQLAQGSVKLLIDMSKEKVAPNLEVVNVTWSFRNLKQ